MIIYFCVNNNNADNEKVNPKNKSLCDLSLIIHVSAKKRKTKKGASEKSRHRREKEQNSRIERTPRT